MGFDLQKQKEDPKAKSARFNLSKNDGNPITPAALDAPKKSGVKYLLMGGLLLAALMGYLMMNNVSSEKEGAQNSTDAQNTGSPVDPSKSISPDVGENATPTNNQPSVTGTTGETAKQNSQNAGKENVSTKTTEPLTAELNKVKIVEDFPKNSAFMNFNQSEIESLISTLKANPNLKLSITGHTDSDGDEGYNMQLSIQRARTLYNYLVENGISGKRLTVRGLGESNPIADNSTESGKAKNRRVEYTMQ